MRREGSKIGIVTWYGTPNYGTTLQAYALYKAVEDLGCDPFLIKRFRTPFTLRNIKDNFNYNLGIRRFWKYDRTPHRKKLKAIRRFCRDNMRERRVTGPYGLRRLLSETGTLIAGSDQIWNCHDHFREFEFLAFAPGKRKISYASSIGTGDIPEQYRSKVAGYLKYYDYISLREKSGADAIAEVTGRSDICTVPDPVFLLDDSGWMECASDAAPKHDYILCYFLRKDDSIAAAVKDISRKLGIRKILMVPSGENPDFRIPGARLCAKAGIEDFISLVHGAAFVCTDSFHGVAMSIRFQRQFVAFRRFSDGDTFSQNGRIYELLRRFGLENRVWNGFLPADYDTDAVGRLSEKARAEGLQYLREALLGSGSVSRGTALPEEYIHPLDESSCYVAGMDDAGASSSGGVAYMLAKWRLETGGRVWASILDANLRAVVAEIRNEEDLQKMRGSKYVHSHFGKEAHQAIEAAVSAGEDALFIGTPCQVAGLRMRVGNAGKLLCADLLCHGSVPPAYLDEELEYLRRRHSLGTPVELSFRDGGRFRMKVSGSNGRVYERDAATQPYYLGYLEGVTLRENCYGCPFASPGRVGDITLGDYITAEGASPGKSFVGLNTAAGREAFAHIREKLLVRGPEGVLEARKSYPPAILEASEKGREYYVFHRCLERRGFSKAVRKALAVKLFRNNPTYKKFHNYCHRIKQKLMR